VPSATLNALVICRAVRAGPRRPRRRAAHAATRGSNGIRWYQPTRAGAKPAVARLWPNNRLIAYLARSRQRLHDLLRHMGRRGDLIDREVRVRGDQSGDALHHQDRIAMCCACETSSCLRAHVQARFTEPTSTTAWTTHARSSRRSITMTSSEPLLTRSPRRRAAHAATRGRSETRWHGSGQQAGVAATSPTWSYRPIRAGCRPAPQGSMSISTVLRRQGRISPTRWAISLLDAAMLAVVFPGLAGQQRVMDAMPSKASRTRHATRGSNGIRWYNPPERGQSPPLRACGPTTG
jgi:hypothetical protein